MVACLVLTRLTPKKHKYHNKKFPSEQIIWYFYGVLGELNTHRYHYFLLSIHCYFLIYEIDQFNTYYEWFLKPKLFIFDFISYVYWVWYIWLKRKHSKILRIGKWKSVCCVLKYIALQLSWLLVSSITW